jgi:Ca2+-transporting ATPase
MAKPPRAADESILTRWHWGAIGGWSVLIAGCVLAALLAGTRGLGATDEAAITLSFLTLAFAKLWFVFNLRSPRSSVVRNAVAGNPWMWGALGVCVVLLAAAVYLPGLSGVLETVPPSGAGWAVALGLSAVPLVVGQVILLVRGRWAARE